MAELKVRPSGGAGGRRGHSNMDHRQRTGEIKRGARVASRREARVQARVGKCEWEAGYSFW